MNKKMKKKLWKIVISAILFALAFVFKAQYELISSMMFTVSYIIVGYDIVIKALKNITRGKVFDENTFDIGQDLSKNPYLKSKFEAERLVLKACTQEEINARIFRIGNIMPRISDGKFQNNFKENTFLIALKTLIDNNMDIYDFINYLKDLTTKGYDIKINRNSGENNSVKIMTIHKSKGLEYHICYYSGLYSEFNIRDLNDKFIFDNKYGIISPYFDEGISKTIYKYLLKEDYIKEEISEKIRLFYVALTRAKEKMILVTDLNQGKKNKDRIKYRSFKDIMLSVIDNFNDYITNIDIEKLDITKDYKKIKQTNYLDYITKTDEKLDIKEILIENEELDEKSFSKKMTKLITKEENDSIKFGLDMHYALEVTDFINPNFDNMDNFIKNKIIKFLDNDLLKNIKNAQIYKEYEFVYEEENEKYHGIIDLMLIYPNHIDIIDYKLKNIIDENYIKQLTGYKKYIENKTKRHVNTYLYSILSEEIKVIE